MLYGVLDMTKKLTPKQELFCREYLIDLNATQAAIRAGYSRNSARSIGEENLTKPDIAAYLQQLMAARAERVDRTGDDVVKSFWAIADFSIKDIATFDGKEFKFKPMTEWPEGAEIAIASIKQTTKEEGAVIDIKFESKLAAAKALGDYLGMFTGYDQLVRAADLYGKKLMDA